MYISVYVCLKEIFPVNVHLLAALCSYQEHDPCIQMTHVWIPAPSVQFSFSHSVMSDSLWPHGLQHTRLPCPSPSPGACSDSGPSSWWYHPTISFSIIPFSSRLQSFPASGSFLMSRLSTSVGQSTGVSASASVLPMNIQGWFPLG